jgi:hypothetical protein
MSVALTLAFTFALALSLPLSAARPIAARLSTRHCQWEVGIVLNKAIQVLIFLWVGDTSGNV